ncbi:DUF5703 domain-containing protein [Arenibacter certesii]|uniref:DUF5703 domain-containing protein n=1 Tax=Arenibacter certesii TaxID=228955 RepID=A0A918J628_9FLAO|nr:DUF5703 domain-containing protein [Arenibacter certesii]GGW50511.1 hypothetical protein GCM10007383_37900 [Arenibacter certesii]
MKNIACQLFVSILFLVPTLFFGQEPKSSVPLSQTDKYNVKWNSPSENSLGSMPAGNGDIGINVWAEKNGDVIFYLAKTDAWSENARLLKIGKVKVSLTPNPFKEGGFFRQELILKDGNIRIESGGGKDKVTIDVWVDANHPVVEVNVTSKKPITARASMESWRTESRQLDNPVELHSAYGLHGEGAPKVIVERDTLLKGYGDKILWAHHNNRSIWEENLKLQGLDEFIGANTDPLLYRTFGALMESKELEKTGPMTLTSKGKVKSFSVSVFAHTIENATLDTWATQLMAISHTIGKKSRIKRFKDHQLWWQSFWDRSYINISSSKESQKEEVYNINRGYALQRYMLACSGRGNSPIKFNGSLFTVDTKDLKGEFEGFDADYRRWGGPYWWQNTRLPYWAMLASGDFEMMKPLFKMYRDALPIRKLATEKYYGHQGAFFPETMYFWGTYVDGNYGRARENLPLGMTENLFIRYYWQSGLEISLMMLDYYSFTRDKVFLKETLLPVVSEIINFYDQHWERDENGKIRFDPAMALETYSVAVNPLPEIVGINKVCSELLKLPDTEVNSSHKTQWARLISEMPQVPIREMNGVRMLAPAQEYSGKQNAENPELYAIFPYRAYGVGKPDLELARNTFHNRAFKQTGGWQQNAIKAAYLGLTDEAAKLTSINFNTSNKAYRFPAMWGPNYDWTPDQDHGAVAMIALQRMLLQYDCDEIHLLPAWPKDWDVDFKLFVPGQGTVTCKVENGSIKLLEHTPQKGNLKITISPEFKM